VLLIGVDTSGKNGSLTLARAPEKATPANVVEIVQTVALEGGTFSAQLIPQLAELLQRNGFSKKDIDAFAVTSGPGSFTGLRVGLAAVKGMAEVLAKPIVAVSLLEAVARARGNESHVSVAIDAGRNELYVAEYEAGRLVGEERLVGRIEFMATVKSNVITTDAGLAERLSAEGKSADLVEHPGSAGVARLGWEKLRAGELVTASDLEANYIRRSDAEIFSKSGPPSAEERKQS
jgi:tRNA threonylcarbamoyladenosine biosynthesis protein TsaB